jgi:hypothetical protein
MVKAQDLKTGFHPLSRVGLLRSYQHRYGGLTFHATIRTRISWEIIAKTNFIRYSDQIKPASHRGGPSSSPDLIMWVL